MVPGRMAAMQLVGHGGVDRLVYRTDVPVPRPGEGELLVKVTATAKNNTDRKVREGLYPTESDSEVTSFQIGGRPKLDFPRIQGADMVGRAVAAGRGVKENRIGEHGLLDFNIYTDHRCDLNLVSDYYGHGRDGGFAEYVVVPDDQFHTVENEIFADAARRSRIRGTFTRTGPIPVITSRSGVPNKPRPTFLGRLVGMGRKERSRLCLHGLLDQTASPGV